MVFDFINAAGLGADIFWSVWSTSPVSFCFYLLVLVLGRAGRAQSKAACACSSFPENADNSLPQRICNSHAIAHLDFEMI